jgi:hypothetical protein
MYKSFGHWIKGLCELMEEEVPEGRCLEYEDHMISLISGIPELEVISRRTTFKQKLDFFLVDVDWDRYYVYYSQIYRNTVVVFDSYEVMWYVYNILEDESYVLVGTFSSFEEMMEAERNGLIRFV